MSVSRWIEHRGYLWLTIISACLAVAGYAQAQSMSGATLVEALRHGGYVVLMRHASSPARPPTASDAEPGSFVLAPTAGRMADRYPISLLGAVGMGMFTLAMALLAVAPAHPAAWDMAWRIALRGLGFGIFGSTNMRAIMSSAPRERSGAVGGINTSFRLLGQASGTALVAVMFRTLAAGHATRRRCG